MISYISETKHLNLIFVQLDELYDPSNIKYYKELNLRTIISKTLGHNETSKEEKEEIK